MGTMTVPTLAITGVAGFIGQRFLAHLEPVVATVPAARIVAFDVREPTRRIAGLELHRLDLAGADLAPRLAGVEVLVHLAAVADPVADAALMRRVNLDATRRLLDAAAGAGVRRVVRISPTTVYGAWPDNLVPLTEDAPLRPNDGYDPGILAAEVERLLADWAAADRDRTVVVLRSAPVLGPGAAHLWARLLAGPTRVRPGGRRAPVQVVHVDDVADALRRAVLALRGGTYNLSATGWIDARDAEALVAPAVLPELPVGLLEPVLDVGWRSGLTEVPPAVLPYLRDPWVVANDRLRAEGWEPRHGNEAVLVATADALAARARLTRRRVVLGAAALGGLVATAAVVSGTRRWRGARRARHPSRG